MWCGRRYLEYRSLSNGTLWYAIRLTRSLRTIKLKLTKRIAKFNYVIMSRIVIKQNSLLFPFVSINCTLVSVCNTGDVRLVGSGSNATQGTVQLCYNNMWGTVCDNGWDMSEATIVCRLLGYYGMFPIYNSEKTYVLSFFRCIRCLF